ncbi:MAG: Peptidoglycan binding protein [Parcubacteria group bacterium Gr01-1014_48]|nr:MAG: Peptidoglycan binding protein [Parcubacteria group bacterium Greene0416_14]TSC74174.1 MAG: Peptidoglycan binding protein [Parcubacteria group bacterium Gr01-1014_48]TSD00850.1 MAG: Peptidoglycan binding protein [Parcubacteria group bacterium Greene1014_15]TSD07932.1 MAG: Peptidoglycan binding protein [Parcubacteria group bacterium Greene0714_4]
MKMQKKIVFLCVASALISALFASAVFGQDFSMNLKQGSTGPEVVRLQEALKSIPGVYPGGAVTGYFGMLTRRAVQKFQMKYGIVSEGDERTTGFGLVGRRTRMKLNELAKKKGASLPVPFLVQPPPLPLTPPPVTPPPIITPQAVRPAPAQISIEPPVLKNFGVRFEEWNKTTGTAGSFLFLPAENKVFLEYGVEVMGPDGPKILPTFEYRVARDTDVLAAIDGVITKLFYKDYTKDYGIHIQPSTNSQWILEHDHVSNPLVSLGDTVKAGDILGKAGTLGGELGRTEIMLFVGGSTITTHCPFKYLDPALKDMYREKILRHIKDWEEFKNNPALYNEESHVLPGCVQETILDK